MRPDPDAVRKPLLRRAVVALTTLIAVALGGACSTGGPVARPADKAPASSPAPSPSSTAAPAGVARYRATTPVLNAAAPVRLEIPSIGVSTDLVPLGLNPDGSMQVPAKWGEAGWYTRGPRPGEDGPAVIAGHVDSTSGPAVFFRLHDLRAGDTVLVTRADHSVVRFVIDRLRQFPKASFPTAAVFGATPGPTLRLITCTGAFDETARSYLDNLVAFASPADS
jgi:sortase (surface protein transpeptidase)